MPSGAIMAAVGRVTKQPALQPIPANVDPAIRQAFSAIHETLNIASGTVGNPLDANPTFRDLVNSGVVQLNWNGGKIGGGGLSLPGVGTITPPGDLTPPPAPTGLAASGAIGNVMLTWDTPTYGNHSYTEIWRHQVTFTNGVADPSVIGNAQRVGTVSGYVGVYADAIGAASDCWYWIRFVSTSDVSGAYNSVSGVRGSTSADPKYLLGVLSGALSKSQLAADLSTPIELISLPSNAAPAPGTIFDIANKAGEAALNLLLKADALKKRSQIEKWVTDATSVIDPVTGKVTLLATAQITTDVEAKLNSVGISLGAIDGTVTSHTASLASHANRISASETSISQLQGDITLKASSSYVDNSVATVLGVIDPAAIDASQNTSAVGMLQILLDNNASRSLAQVAGARVSAAERVLSSISDSISAQATEHLILAARVDYNLAAQVSESISRATADQALSSQIMTLLAQVNDPTTGLPSAHSAIKSEATSRASADSATSTSIYTLQTSVSENTASIQASQNVSASGALQILLDNNASRKLAQSATARASVAERTLTTLSDAVSAQATERLILAAKVDSNFSAIVAESKIRATENSALSSSIYTLQTSVNGNTSSIQTHQTSIDGLSAQYTVKTDVNGYVSGFGLATTAANGTPYSDFIISADRFSIVNPATQHTPGTPAPAASYPFYVVATPFANNGVTVPAGVYMKTAYIQDGAITNAKIGSAAVDTAKIANLAVSTAKISDLAVSSAKIQDLAVTTAKIALAQITTALIADAAITSAKIADAQITTLKIATGNVLTGNIGYQQVTIPMSASSKTQQAMGTNLSCTINSTGAPIAIVAAVSCTCNASNTAQAWIRFAVYRDGVLLADAFVTEGGIPTAFGFVGPLNGNGTIVVTDSTAGAGVHTYTVVTSVTGSALSAVFNSGGINIMEVKR